MNDTYEVPSVRTCGSRFERFAAFRLRLSSDEIVVDCAPQEDRGGERFGKVPGAFFEIRRFSLSEVGSVFVHASENGWSGIDSPLKCSNETVICFDTKPEKIHVPFNCFGRIGFGMNTAFARVQNDHYEHFVRNVVGGIRKANSSSVFISAAPPRASWIWGASPSRSATASGVLVSHPLRFDPKRIPKWVFPGREMEGLV